MTPEARGHVHRTSKIVLSRIIRPGMATAAGCPGMDDVTRASELFAQGILFAKMGRNFDFTLRGKNKKSGGLIHSVNEKTGQKIFSLGIREQIYFYPL